MKLLGGSGPLVTIADNLLGGALSLATAGGSDLAVSLFDAKAEAIRLGHLVSSKIAEAVRGLGRFDRSRRLQAAHAVLVVAAFFEALDDCLRAAGMESPGFGRDDQIALATRRAVDGDWLGRLLAAEIPAPSAERSYNQLLDGLKDWFRGVAQKTADHLSGFAVWEQSNERTRHTVKNLLSTQLPSRAVERYEEAIRRLSQALPEVDIWLRQLESRAAARGLEDLEAALLRATSSRDPGRQRAALTAVYRSELGRPIFSGDVGDVEMPTLGAAYVDPLFRVKSAGAGARPAEEEWWDTAPRRDLAGFLATYLTTPQAADAPMLLLGQPGAGKSSLTRILAARLPAADFLVVRVALREVRAEAEIQDQVEQALRGAVGESVAWADLARDAGGAMPVILLDGFDELLQAIGVHQSDYLQRVASFQQREAVLGRPVAVLVTSRVAVADRARLPAGALAVRLEPFDQPQIERWLDTWNTTNAGRPPLSLGVLQRFHDLAVQPLLLLMLALYDAAGNALSDVDETFDTGQLYERLLSEFADREVRRAHAGGPEPAMPGLVEAELLRLSVVAFAMFHRLRLWVTTEELDADLASLGLRPSQPSPTEGFRTPLTAGQEMVGRFFFIQRAQALQDDQTRQTYEFLHATFGEYLVARLVVQALRDAAARAHARTLRLGPSDESDLLQSLLGFTPLSAGTTVLPFATALIRRIASAEIREWLVEQLRTAVTRPQYLPRPYQPVEKRVDHWMATYSFNLMLLTLACGGPLRASDLHQDASDPAGCLRDTALQWRAAVPGRIWHDALDPMTITRVWADDGRRDLILETSLGSPVTVAEGGPRRDVEDVDPFWSHSFGLDWDFRNAGPQSGFSNFFPISLALKSMHLSNALSEDALRHVLDPLLDRLPNAVASFVLHGPDDTESAAHSLVHLWLTSTLDKEPARLLLAYDRAALAVAGPAWGPFSPDVSASAFPAIQLFLRLLAADANRLATTDVVRLVRTVRSNEWFDHSAHLLPAAECLLADTSPFADERDLLIDEMLFDLQTRIGGMLPEDCLRLLIALAGARSAASKTTLAALEDRLASATVQERVRADSDFAARLYAARDRLSSDDEPLS